MSMHKIPLTPLEEEGMRLHGLPIGTPSQRSDTFRQGVAWGIGEAKRLAEENERLRKDAERYRWFRAAPLEDVLRLSHYAFYALDAAIDAARGHSSRAQNGG